VSKFFAMGGYGAFVWSCFALAGVVLTWNVIAARRLHAAAMLRAMRLYNGGKRSP
jgi:heme exporter protein CcmD